MPPNWEKHPYRYLAWYRKTHSNIVEESNLHVDSHQVELRHATKLAYCELLGNKCVTCGEIVTAINVCAFDFHHIDSDRERAREWINAPSRFRAKLKNNRIMLLCAYCHRLEHNAPHERVIQCH